MHYRILGDLVVLIHLCYIAFSVLGGLLVLRRRWWAYIHIPAVLWAALIEFRGWLCPLTPIENWLRQAGGVAGYKAGFIEHYIVPVIYPSSLTRSMQMALGILVLIINLCIYVWIWHKLATAHH